MCVYSATKETVPHCGLKCQCCIQTIQTKQENAEATVTEMWEVEEKRDKGELDGLAES